MRVPVVLAVLPFFAALSATGTPAVPAVAAAAVERAPVLGGEAERTPVVASNQTPLQLHVARAATARPGFWKLPPHILTLRFVATPPAPSVLARATESSRAPWTPPAAPRSCRGPPRT